KSLGSDWIEVHDGAFDGIEQLVQERGALGGVFFQAEDGIRDYKVTGVQTCALPISLLYALGRRARWSGALVARGSERGLGIGGRSEERRVGKVCRCRRCPYRLTNTDIVSASSNLCVVHK